MWPMSLKSFLGHLFAPENPALTAHEAVLKRLDALEEAVDTLASDQDEVIKKVRSWAAREAARVRHEATKSLDDMLDARAGESGSEGQPDPAAREATKLAEFADQRAAAKAAVARRLRGIG